MTKVKKSAKAVKSARKTYDEKIINRAQWAAKREKHEQDRSRRDRQQEK